MTRKLRSWTILQNEIIPSCIFEIAPELPSEPGNPSRHGMITAKRRKPDLPVRLVNSGCYRWRMKMSIEEAIRTIERFKGTNLTDNIATIEMDIVDLDRSDSARYCNERGIDDDLLSSAFAVKKASSQIDVIIHAAGILHSLKNILETGEVIESLSLGAGSTGKRFDLETNFRVAEFKFIDWKGGSETIRQNNLFMDFFELAEYETEKRKCLYVMGTESPLKFLNGRRALNSVLRGDPKNILRTIADKYGPKVATVRDYYLLKEAEVEIHDIGIHIGRTV